MSIKIYRLLERLDGEKGVKLIPYSIAQRFKVLLLRYFIN